MKHSLNELLDIIYRYYPRGVGITDDVDIQLRNATEEHARLVAARIRASKDDRWHAMLRRVEGRFPGMVMNESLHLPSGGCDGCYSFRLDLTESTGRTLWFQVSFLAPYYIIHGSRTIEIVKQQPTDFFLVDFRGMHFRVSRSPLDPRLISNPDHEIPRTVTVKREYVTFELSPDEEPYADWVAQEIEAIFGCERMPPEVGTALVPEVATDLRIPGEVRVYDCLFSEHEWVKPSPSDVPAPRIRVDVASLTERFVAVLTVLRAHHQIGLTFTLPEAVLRFPEPYRQSVGVFASVSTDGFLHKDKMLEELARMRPHDESPETLRAMAAKRELEALVAAWDGEGDPPAGMVAWASSFLASWPLESEPEARS